MKGITTFNTETNRFEEFPNPVTVDAQGGSFVHRVPIDADLLDGKLPEHYEDVAVITTENTFEEVKALYSAGKNIFLKKRLNADVRYYELSGLTVNPQNTDAIGQFKFSYNYSDITAIIILTHEGWSEETQVKLMKSLSSGRSDMLKLDGDGQPTYAVPNVDYVTPGNGVPEGAIIMWSGDVIPEGWALCNGLNGTPDLRDKFIVGAGGSYNIGATGGSNEVTLDVGNLPSHKHNNTVSFDTSNLTMEDAGGHEHNVGAKISSGTTVATDLQLEYVYQMCDQGTNVGGVRSGTSSSKLRAFSAGSHKHTFSIDGNPVSITNANTGSGTAHENRPPYYALAFIMKTYSN